MKRHAAWALGLVLTLGCGGGMESKPEPKPEAKPAPVAPRPEPDRIVVAHVLIAFRGTGTPATRSKAEAEKLAQDVFARATKGEDFNKLIKDLSDDSGEGVYGMCNLGIKPANENEYPRNKMVPAFGDVGFKLEVGGIGMSAHDPMKSPYGWHIIKRLK